MKKDQRIQNLKSRKSRGHLTVIYNGTRKFLNIHWFQGKGNDILTNNS